MAGLQNMFGGMAGLGQPSPSQNQGGSNIFAPSGFSLPGQPGAMNTRGAPQAAGAVNASAGGGSNQFMQMMMMAAMAAAMS